MQVVCSYGACDELTACPREVQLAVAIDTMGTKRTGTKAITGNCVADDHRWLMEKRQRNNVGRIAADIGRESWREHAKNETVHAVSVGLDHLIDPSQKCTSLKY